MGENDPSRREALMGLAAAPLFAGALDAQDAGSSLCFTSTVEMALGSTCHLRIATIEEAPQSTSTLPSAARSR